MSEVFDVVVVGAGLSGLQAARSIQGAGLSCLVLEAMDRVGGKTHSVEASPQGGIVDVGAAWINDTNQSEMYALAQEFGFDLKVQRADGVSLAQDRDGKITSFLLGKKSATSTTEQGLKKEVIITLVQLIESIQSDAPHLSPDALELDRMTLQELGIKRFPNNPFAVPLLDELAAAFLGVESEEASALYFLDYCKCGTGLANMTSDKKEGGQYLRNRQGNESFSRCLAATLAQGSVRLSTPVRKISQDTLNTCTIETTTGLQISGKRVVVSVPTANYSSLEFEPPLPRQKKELADGTALGYYAKTIFVFAQPWWREANLSGTFSSESGPISFTRDTCIEEDEQYSITCFLVGDTGRRWSKFSQKVRRQQVTDQFYKIFGSLVTDIPGPINVIEKEWTKDIWTKGAPSPIMSPGIMTSEAGRAIRDPFMSVHFTGTETSLVWKGYMEGAVRSGKRVAAEVIGALKQSAV